MRKVRKCNRFYKSQNLRIFRGLGEDDSWKNLKQKILGWHCPFKAKHQCTKECTDVTSQNFIKILSLETIPLKSNNSIYKITTPSYGVKEEICRRMPRNFFFFQPQFQRKRKCLVFFQSINFFVWPLPSLHDTAHDGVLCTFSTRTSATAAGFARSSQLSSSWPWQAAWTVHHKTNLIRLGHSLTLLQRQAI